MKVVMLALTFSSVYIMSMCEMCRDCVLLYTNGKKIDKTDNNLWAVRLINGECSFPHHDL